MDIVSWTRTTVMETKMDNKFYWYHDVFFTGLVALFLAIAVLTMIVAVILLTAAIKAVVGSWFLIVALAVWTYCGYRTIKSL